MGLYTELEYDDYVFVPEASHHSFQCSKAQVRDNKGKFITTRGYSITSLDDEFIQINCCIPLDYATVVDNTVLEKDSLYQSLKVAGEKLRDFETRKKIDVSYNGDVSFSLSTMDSSFPDEIGAALEKKRSPISLNVDSFPTSGSKDFTEPAYRGLRGCVTDNFSSSDGFIEICMDLEDRDYYSREIIIEGPMKRSKFRCNQTSGHLDDDSALLERDKTLMLHKKSSLERLNLPFLPCKSIGEDSKAGPKSHFTPFRKILDPFMKSKYQQGSSISVTKLGDVATIGSGNSRRNGVLHRFLLRDFLNIEHRTESGSQCVEEDHSSAVASSPTHLRGLLKLKFEHGVPFFEFSMKDTEDVLSAKICKVGDSFNWVYTFHSLDIRSDCRNGAKERKKEYSLIGQMQVSCHLCSEMSKNGTSDCSMVAEFVLYDMEYARKSLYTQENSYCSTNSINLTNCTSGHSLVKGDAPWKLNHVSNLLNDKKQKLRNVSGDDDSDALNNLPWATSVLHRYLQIAAIVVEVPFEGEESLTEKPGNKFEVDKFFSLSEHSAVHWKNKDVINCINPANVKVVTSSGVHGLPSTEDGVGPSSLLDRWRSGGGCDCGGWDMACPLSLLDCPGDQKMAQHPYMESCRPLELFVQGLKEKIPAFSIEVIDEGLYSVKFHDRLSMLQAFSISVAILHSSEISSLVQNVRNSQRLQCNSLLHEEEVKFLVDAVAEKKTVGKKMEEVTQSFLINPPFSPIARL